MISAVSVPDADTPAALAILLENHRAFLRYLERRVGDRALAIENAVRPAPARTTVVVQAFRPARDTADLMVRTTPD
jgi:hypothetical protein